MEKEKDSLGIKIYQAMSLLSEEARDAISSVPWRGAILEMRETKGYSFEQLDTLEIETELLLCGLVSIEDYPKELESRMKITKTEVDSLIDQMNESVFKKIRRKLEESIDKSKKIEEQPSEKSMQDNLLNSLAYAILKRNGELVDNKNYKESPEYKKFKENPNEIEEPTVESINKERIKNVKLPVGKNSKISNPTDTNNENHDKIMKSAGIEILTPNAPLEIEGAKESKEISAPKIQS
jgi:hypothetical protein